MSGQTSSSVTLTSSLNPSTYGSSVTFTAAVTPANATGTVTFNDGSATLGTGTISSGTATYSTSALSAGSHSITAVYGGDSNYDSSTSSVVTQTINPAPQVVTTSLPAGEAGTSYSATLAATAGTTPYTWSISSGSLPAGLSLNAGTGAITGIPTVGGTTNFTVQVTDANSMTATQPLSIVVMLLPSGWLDQDVGSVSVAGSASYSGGTFTVKGGGTLGGGTADGFHFVYQSLSGDGSIVARVVSLQGVTSPTAGVMIRESLNSNATDAFVYYQTNYGTLKTRTTTGGNATNQTVSFTSSTPYWLKLVRSGSSFTGYISTDGFDWVQIATSTITMATNAYIGLAVANGGSTTVETATFDNVSVSSTAIPAPVITSISATTGSIGSQVTITGANFGSTQGGSAVLLNGSAVTINTWSGTAITFTIPAGATSGPLLVSMAPSMNDSNAIYFTVEAQPLPSGWLDQDVGSVSVAGSASYSGGTFTVKGGGTLGGGTADGFHFVYQSLSGDGSIVARVVSLQGVTSPTAGVMIRESLNSNATDAFVYYQTNYGTLKTRTTTGGNATNQTVSFTSSTPYWLKLVRSGSSFTGYISTDGFDWVQIATSTITMATNAYIGLAVANGGSTTVETATFDNVSVSSTAIPAPVITSISATTGSIGSQVTITGANFGSTQGGSAVLLNGSAVTINTWSGTAITFTIPAGATSGPLLVSMAPSMNDSNAIYFTVEAQPLPSGWLDQDVGSVSVAGSASYSGGTFTVKGGGTLGGGTADGFHFVYQSLSGDGSIVARVVSLQGVTSPTAGVMIRESLNSNATDAFVYYQTNYGTLKTRTTTGGNATNQTVSFTSSTPYWLKLVRSGSSFTGYISTDGFDWVQIATSTITMATNAYIGLAVANGGSTTVETATFDNVSVSSTAIPAPVITSISATTGSIGSQVTITGANFGSTPGSAVLLNGFAMTLSSWTNTSITFTVPTGAASGLLVVSTAPTMNDSNAVYFAVTSQPLPPGWLDQDVGSVSVAGSASYSGGAFTITGGGNIGGTADSMHFVYQSLTGDGSITARVSSLQGSSPEAAVMIRETLGSNSTDAYVSFHPNQAYLYSRATTGASISTQATSFSTTTPYWLELVRSGSSFTGYISTNGFDWIQVATSTITMAQNVYIGLAVSGGTGSSVTFDNVSINSTAAPAPVITSISGTTGSVGSQLQITGANFGASQAGSLVTVNGMQAPIDLWTDTSIVFTIPAGATSGFVLVLEAPSMNDSNPVYLTVTSQPLPSPWLDLDIGTPTTTGSATYAGGTFTVKGAGGIGNTTDAFHFVYQPLTGDGSIVARVDSLQGTQSPQVGVMVRETLAQNSTYAFVYFQPNQVFLSSRATTGATSSSQASGFASSASPYWVRLIRTGNAFTAYISPDGSSWTQAGTSTTVTMAQSVYIGMAVSGGSGSLETATLDNVSVVFGTTPYVSSITPLVGGVGTSVSVTGSNFGQTQGSSLINFNGAPASSVTSWSDSQIVATVPSAVPPGTGPVTVVANSIQSNGNVMFTAVNPVINNITPPGAAAGATVTLNGSGLTLPGESTQVSFNGISAQILSSSSTSLTVYVPENATSGPVTVSVGSYTSIAVQFTVLPPPTITSLSPTTGEPTTVITIDGSGFGATQSNSTAAVGGIPAPVSSWSDGQIVATVPEIAMNGPVSVTVAGVTAQGPLFIYNAMNQLTASNGAVTSYSSGDWGGGWRLYSSAGPGCSTCSMRGNILNSYDTNGNLLSTTDANGNTVTYTYDGNNNMLTQTAQLNGQSVTTSYSYNNFSEVLTMTDPLGNTTTNTYDANGNLLTVSSPAPNGQTPPSVTQFAYNTVGELTQILDPLNHPTAIAYYPTGLIQSITDAQNDITSYTYDTRGNRTSVIDPINGAAHPTAFTYDAMSRLTGITYPDGTSAGFAYDTRGRRISATDPNGKTTTYAYDDADRLVSVTDAAGNLTQYGYDTEGNLVSITDANNHTTYFAYDTMGRVIQTTFPSTLTETYGYDQLYNLTSKTDRKGQTIQYVYDSLYRMISKTYPDQTSASYVYDLVGKIQQVTDPTGAYAFAYDNMGRLIGTSTQYTFLPGFNFQNGYTYDAASNRTSLTAPDGSTNTYQYDTLNRLATLTNSLTGQFGFGYDALSRRTQLTRPNGVNTNYNYDSVSHLLSVLHQAGSTTLDGDSYSYDYAGNRTSKTNYLNGTTWNYGYDAIYELLQVTHGGSTKESFSYDAVGNRLSSLSVPSYSYNSSNELTATSNGSYAYDANGNTLSDPSGKQYTWDFENRLTQAIVPGVGTVTFRYDPFGRRIQKSGPSGTTNYLYDGMNTDASLIEEVDNSGNILARYTQSPEVDQPLAELRSGTTSYYQQDALNSVTSLSNGTGAIANTYTYDAFGKLSGSTGALINPFQYTGRDYDSESSLHYYRARYYDQSVGRFIGEDPVGFNGGANFYRYVLNNPVKWTDAMGLSSRDVQRIEAACHKCTKRYLTDPGLRADVNTDLGGEWNDLTTWWTKRVGCWTQALIVEPCLENPVQPYDDTWTFNVVYWPINNHVVRASSSNPNDPDVVCDPWRNQAWTSSKPRGR